MDRDTMDHTAMSPFPDLGAIAKLATYAERRRALADAMRFFSGTEPDAVLLDHQMIATGLAAGHRFDKAGPRWSNPLDDPAVVIGLVLHHAQHNTRRGLPIPPSLLRRLNRHIAAGNPAARLVRDWLGARTVQCGRRHLWVHEGGKA